MTTKRLYLDPRLNTDRRYAALTLAVIAAGCVAAFSGFNLGLPGMGDEGYQALCVNDYRNNPLGMLSFYIGHLWQGLWGKSIAALRALASLEMLLAVGLGALYLYRRSGRALMSAGVFAIALIAGRASAFQLYNWDTGSYLFDAIALVAVASFLRSADARKVAVAGVAVGCMALARVPSAVFFPLIFGFIWAGCRRHGFDRRATALCLGVYTATAAATVLLLIGLMCGSLAEYLAAFRPENLVGGHSPSDLPEWIRRIGQLGYNQLVWMTPSAVAVAAGIFLCYLRPGHRLIRWGIFLILIALSAVIYRHRAAWGEFEWNSLGADLPLTLFILTALPLWNLTHRQRLATPRLDMWWCATMALMMTFGSDTFFERVCGAWVIPVAIAVGWPVAAEGLRRAVRWVLLASLAVFGAIVAEQWVMKAAIDTARPPERYEALRGMKISPRALEWLEANEAVTTAARRADLPYVYCVNRFVPQLIFGRDNGPRVSLFNIDYSEPETWPQEQIEAMNNASVVIFNDISHEEIFQHLRSLGFADVMHRDEVHVFARPGQLHDDEKQKIY